jgi:transcription-repair coupling factor (superfamily II helicase)
MLERTIGELRGEERPEQVETQLNLALNIRIPAEYIAEENQRLRMYKRVAGVENEKQLADVQGELEDRYGPLPPPVKNLAEYAALRLLARRQGVLTIDRKREQVNVKFSETAKIDPQKLAQFVTANRGAQFTPGGMLRFQLTGAAPEQVLIRLREVLQSLGSEEAELRDAD